MSVPQSEGPVYTLDELATYFASPSPRKPLLNVVSLDLANTLLHDMVMRCNSLNIMNLIRFFSRFLDAIQRTPIAIPIFSCSHCAYKHFLVYACLGFVVL